MLTIDTGIIESARDKGINISRIAEDSLREILETYEHNQLPENCEHKWTWAFSVPSGLAKQCKKCGYITKVRLK